MTAPKDGKGNPLEESPEAARVRQTLEESPEAARVRQLLSEISPIQNPFEESPILKLCEESPILKLFEESPDAARFRRIMEQASEIDRRWQRLAPPQADSARLLEIFEAKRRQREHPPTPAPAPAPAPALRNGKAAKLEVLESLLGEIDRRAAKQGAGFDRHSLPGTKQE